MSNEELTESPTLETIPDDLSEQVWRVVFRHKALWGLGIVSALANAGVSIKQVYPLVSGIGDSSFPYRNLASIMLWEVPQVGTMQWLSERAYPLTLAIGLPLVLWCFHFVAQVMLMRAGHDLAQGRQTHFRQLFIQSIRGEWIRLLLLNLLLFGIFYLIALLGIWLFRQGPFPTIQLELQSLQPYLSRPHRVLGFILSVLLVPASLIAPMIYPFAKRAMLLGNRSHVASLKHAVLLIRQNPWNAFGVILYAGGVYAILSFFTIGLLMFLSIFEPFVPTFFKQDNMKLFASVIVFLVSTVLFGYMVAAISIFVTAYYAKFEQKFAESAKE